MRKLRNLLLGLLALLLIFPSAVFASSHYTFEHAEEMRTSGRIDWREYGPDAFNEAISENKPIFLMLTAPSWCYWCHVYTSDDYIYNSELYPTINEKTIPIYVDADKRQDLTRKYLEGGWPSTTVMTPSGERLFGFSGPRPIPNILANLKQSIEYVNTTGFSNQVSFDYKEEKPVVPTAIQLNTLVSNYESYVLRAYDTIHGGFGTGKKFPQGRALDFALEIYESTENEAYLALVENTLRNQYTKLEEIETNYNLFDPVEGGFHRYGTARDWTPPHYEKMLYDNVRLLKAYSHLSLIRPDDALATKVVEMTDRYIEDNWYDASNGGFYGNTDVHGEDHYYGQNPRPVDRPRIEKTKYSDWNSDAISTYLYLWDTTGNEKYKEMASKSLDFFAKHMVTDGGAYHYFQEDGSKAVRGSLLDNSYLLLAFTEGYEVLEDERYLATAKKIAEHSLRDLYDWNSGGFFERNSLDTHLYAPGENIDLSKPPTENGVIAYALLKLYEQTGELEYLNAGIKTLGNKLGQVGGLDRGYHIMKAAQLAVNQDLISEYHNNAAEIEKIEQAGIKTFWVNDLIAKPETFVPTDEGLEKLEGPLLLLLLIAFFAGLLSFLSPCTLPILPAYLAYTFKSSKKNVKGMTIAFFCRARPCIHLVGYDGFVYRRLFKVQYDPLFSSRGNFDYVVWLFNFARKRILWFED